MKAVLLALFCALTVSQAIAAPNSLDDSGVSGSLILPTGTTGARPTGTAGMIRYNSTTDQVEGYLNSTATWAALGGSGGLSTPVSVANGGTGASLIPASNYVPLSQRDPMATDDINAGYAVGDHWVNFKAKKIWTCYDNTVGAARWQQSAWPDAPLVDYVNPSAFAAAYGVTRLKNSYSGNLVDIYTSTGTSYSIGQVAPDYALDSKTLFGDTGTASAGVKTLYDQVGSNNLVQSTATFAKLPPLAGRKVNGFTPISFNGLEQNEAEASSASLYTNTGTIAANAFGAFLIARKTAAQDDCAMMQIGQGTYKDAIYTSIGGVAGMSIGLSNSASQGLSPLTGNVALFGINSGASDFVMYANDNAYDLGGYYAAVNFTGGYYLGDAPVLGTNFPCGMEALAYLITNKSLSSAELSRLQMASYADFHIVPQARKTFLPIGDSRCAGLHANNNTTWTTLIAQQLDGSVATKALCSPGYTTANVISYISNYTNQIVAHGRYTVVLDLGTNNFYTGVSASATYTDLGTIVTDLRNRATSVGATVKVVVLTVLPGASMNLTSQAAFNTLVMANTIGADLVLDQASDATLSTVATNSSISPDGIHLNELGQEVQYNFLFPHIAPLLDF